MLVSLRWLKDYVDIPWSAHVLADRLTMIGAKVEGIHELGAGLSDVYVGKITRVEPHPKSDELFVCQVDVGGKSVQSVCGASNTAEGLLVAVALPGASLTGLERPVRAGEVRGVTSEAVLCSESELGLSEDHSGLMLLPDDLEIGKNLVDALGLDDHVIEFEIYPNRPDCLSVVGIAREAAAVTGGDITLPDTSVVERGPEVSEAASVEVLDADLCPRYIARVVEDVKIGPSPAWMQQRLRAAGMRPINNVVDVTNFVMLELGQPLHAFDRDRLSDAKILVRRATQGERMQTLDGEIREFTVEDLLICDGAGPVAVAGIMGGESTEVSDATTSILLESATFDAASVRKTSRRLGMRTEASHRFEKGLHPHLAQLAVDRAARLLAELARGTVYAGRIDAAQAEPEEETTLSVRLKRVNRALGTQLSPAEMKRIMRALHFDAELDDGASVLRVSVPWYRPDVRQECDVVEEIARIYGFDNIEATLPSGASVEGRLAWPLPLVESVKDRLVAAGFSESVTYSFVSPRTFDRLHVEADSSLREAIPLQNPLSEEQSVMRTTLMGSLLDAVSLNERRQVHDIRLFETGKVYIPSALPLESLPSECWTLGMVLSGRAPTQVWGSPSREVDFFDLKGAIEAVADALHIGAEYERVQHPVLHPGRCAQMIVACKSVGVFGEVHPRVAAAYSLRGRTYIAEVNLQALFDASSPAQRYQPLPRHPAVDRDLALLVPTSVPAVHVQDLIQREGGEYLRSLELFDVYEGKQVPEGMRSVAYTLTFQAEGRTLTDEEIASAQTHLAKRLDQELGVEVRS